MPAKARAQIGMEDTIVKDAELEKMLEERQELKQSVSDYGKLDKSVKDKLRSIETPTPYRVGRFVITRSAMEPRPVSFETQASFRFNIKLAGEE